MTYQLQIHVCRTCGETNVREVTMQRGRPRVTCRRCVKGRRAQPVIPKRGQLACNASELAVGRSGGEGCDDGH